MEPNVWHTESGARATDRMMRLLAEHGSPQMRLIAADVLADRHSLRDLAYLSDHSGQSMKSIGPWLRLWEQASTQEREDAIAQSERTVRNIVDAVNALPSSAKEPPSPPRHDGTDDRSDFSDLTLMRDALGRD